MFCFKCGKEIPDEATFCPKCGAVQKPKEAFGDESDEIATKFVKNNSIKVVVVAVIALCIGVICGFIYVGDRRGSDKSVDVDEPMVKQQADSESLSDEAADNQIIFEKEADENTNLKKSAGDLNDADKQDSDKRFEDFTEEEWKNLALKYFMEVESAPASAYVPSEVDVYFDDPEPGMVSIHLYDDMGTHDATANWYCVNIKSGVGTDTSNNPVDFNKVIRSADENATLDSSEGGWKESFKLFIESGKYLGSGEGYDEGSTGEDFESISFGLYDMDADGIPELIISNGYESYAENAKYVYEYKNNKVSYIGILPGILYNFRHGSDIDFPGLFVDGGHDGEMWTDYYCKTGSILESDSVVVESEGYETYRNNNMKLTSENDNAWDGFELLSINYYFDIGWEGFLKEYGYD